jgi:5-methyltetrahydropteroyltriglutamate--homocysteine methyltransferase
LDEPFLVTDLDQDKKAAFQLSFLELAKAETRPNVMLATYFDDITINKELIYISPFEGLHIDLTNTYDPLELIRSLPRFQALSIGVIDGVTSGN